MKMANGFEIVFKYKAVAFKYLVFAMLIVPGLTAETARADPQTAARFADYVYGVKPMTSGSGIAAGIDEFTELVESDPSNGEAIFGLGALHFLRAIEEFQQDLYRYGAGNKGGLKQARLISRGFKMPIPQNPDPEVLSYEKFREILVRYEERLQWASQVLEKVGNMPVKLPLQPHRIGFDVNNDGVISQNENYSAAKSSKRRFRTPKLVFEPGQKIVFDTADAKWLQGYSTILMSGANFFLSFDFEKSYDVAFQMVFGNQATDFGRKLDLTKPDADTVKKIMAEIEEVKILNAAIFSIADGKRRRVLNSVKRKLRRDKTLTNSEKEMRMQENSEELEGLNLQYKKNKYYIAQIKRLRGKLIVGGVGRSWSGYFPIVNFIHTFNWPIVDRGKFQKIRIDLLTVLKLNRETWKMVAQETDDDHEWLPNAQQTSPFAKLPVTQPLIDQWRLYNSELEKVLEGQLLVPHRALLGGINLKSFFENAQKLDLVLFLTGPDAIQYVGDGPEWDAAKTKLNSKLLSRNFGSYLAWFH